MSNAWIEPKNAAMRTICIDHESERNILDRVTLRALEAVTADTLDEDIEELPKMIALVSRTDRVREDIETFFEKRKPA